MVRNYKRKTNKPIWSKEELLEAITHVQNGRLKINEAARQYGISRATLYRQYQKFVVAGGNLDVTQFRTCGGNPILTKVEENIFAKTIQDLRKEGTVTSTDVKRICFEYCWANGIPNQFKLDKRLASDDWYYGFVKRHPEIKTEKPIKPPTPKKSTKETAEIKDEPAGMDVDDERLLEIEANEPEDLNQA